MIRRPARARCLAVALVVLGAGCHTSLAGSGGSAGAPLASSSSSAAGSGGAAGGSTGDSAGRGGLATVPPAGAGSVAGAGDNNLVTLDGKARSVETTASVGGLASMHLSGTSALTATGDVIDHTGRDLGTGTLRADGTDLVVTGTSMQLASRVRVQPALVTVNTGGQASLTLGFSGSATVTSGHLTFQPPPPPAPATPVTRAAPAGSPTTVAPATTVPPPVPIAAPVTLKAGGIQVSGPDLRFVDAPVDIGVSSSEADLSWAGSGSITTAQGPLNATYLGVRAQRLIVTLHRTSAEVDVHGTGLALQAYSNGVPQLKTPARIDVLSTGATTGFLGKHHAFVWTPRNLGNTYDMAILSIHPANAAASGVYVGLLPMPPMFGGEAHAPVGGDTAGLKGGEAIDSLIARHGDDKRSVGYDAPAGVPLVLIIQGNFDPITVTVTTY